MTTFWLAPTTATGAELATEAVMLVAATSLSTLPSLTMSVTTYTPATFGVKLGLGELKDESADVDVVGLVMMFHR